MSITKVSIALGIEDEGLSLISAPEMRLNIKSLLDQINYISPTSPRFTLLDKIIPLTTKPSIEDIVKRYKGQRLTMSITWHQKDQSQYYLLTGRLDTCVRLKDGVAICLVVDKVESRMDIIDDDVKQGRRLID